MPLCRRFNHYRGDQVNGVLHRLRALKPDPVGGVCEKGWNRDPILFQQPVRGLRAIVSKSRSHLLSKSGSLKGSSESWPAALQPRQVDKTLAAVGERLRFTSLPLAQSGDLVRKLPPHPLGLPSLPLVVAKLVGLGFSLELPIMFESSSIQLS